MRDAARKSAVNATYASLFGIGVSADRRNNPTGMTIAIGTRRH
jgi:hypothetical protein